jgi:hypothetical protein
MNLVSFVDELVKISAMRSLVKRASGEIDATSNVNSVEPPASIMGGGAVPPSLRIVPERAATRLPESVDIPSQIVAGSLGNVTGSKDPIDRDKFNRWYRDKR